MIKKCQICGQNSGMYPLCKTHMEYKEKGIIKKNELTNKWEWVKSAIDKLSEKTNNNTKNEIYQTNCLICGNKTENGFLFCKNHYKEYKDKSIYESLLEITNGVLENQQKRKAVQEADEVEENILRKKGER